MADPQANKAAQATVLVTRDIGKRQLRAYVVLVACEFQIISEGILLTAVLKNSGQTPAYNLQMEGETFLDDYPLSNERPHPVPSDGYAAPIGVGGDVKCAQRLFTDDAESVLYEVKSGKLGLWIQGTVKYDDCFGEKHTTKFRYVFGGRLAGTDGMGLHADREGNEAD